MPEILESIRNMEAACKRFDSESYPWAKRKSFSLLASSDKILIHDLIHRIITILKQANSETFIVSSFEEQSKLRQSLDVLASERGMFRKLKPKWSDAHEFAKRILKDGDFVDDLDYISRISERVKKGHELWDSLSKLTSYLTDKGAEELKSTPKVGMIFCSSFQT